MPRNNQTSFPIIYLELLDSLKAKYEGVSQYTDFFSGSAGRQQISVGASLADLISFNTNMARLEQYLPSAKLLSSVYNMSANLGYVPNRAKASRITVNYDVNATRIIPKSTLFATMGTIKLSLIDDLNVVAGSVGTAELASGEWKTEQFTIATTEESGQVWVTGDIPNIDQDLIEIKVNNVEIPYTYFHEDLTTDNVLLVNLGSHLVLQWGDNVIGKKLNQNDVVKFTYLVVGKEIKNQAVNPVSIIWDEVSFLRDSVTFLARNTPPDPPSKITMLAPTYRNARRRMISPKDFSVILSAQAGIASATVTKKDATRSVDKSACCDVCVTYVKLDGTVLSATEIQGIETSIYDNKYVNAELTYRAGTPVGINVKLHIATKGEVDAVAIDNEIKAYFDLLVLNLGAYYNPYDMVKVIERVAPNVDRVYLEHPTSDFQLLSCQYFVLNNLDYVWYDSNNLVEVPLSSLGYEPATIPDDSCCRNLLPASLPPNLQVTIPIALYGAYSPEQQVMVLNAEFTESLAEYLT